MPGEGIFDKYVSAAPEAPPANPATTTAPPATAPDPATSAEPSGQAPPATTPPAPRVYASKFKTDDELEKAYI